MRAHILPLTNCAFNKSGDRFITGSYDRTCKVIRAAGLGLGFITGSYDRTCKASSGFALGLGSGSGSEP